MAWSGDYSIKDVALRDDKFFHIGYLCLFLFLSLSLAELGRDTLGTIVMMSQYLHYNDVSLGMDTMFYSAYCVIKMSTRHVF